jgi:hypothetical protein
VGMSRQKRCILRVEVRVPVVLTYFLPIDQERPMKPEVGCRSMCLHQAGSGLSPAVFSVLPALQSAVKAFGPECQGSNSGEV